VFIVLYSCVQKKAKLMNFDYVNKFTRDDALKITIKLPVISTGEPDWKYMETYIKRLYTRERERERVQRMLQIM